MALKLSVFLIFVVLLGCVLHSQALTQISNCLELQGMKDNLSEDYELVNDIDCSDTVNWNGGQGFEPVGNEPQPFLGIFNGQNYQIINLVINRPDGSDVGLFGSINIPAKVSSVVLAGGKAVGYRYVGRLLGRNFASVDTCYTSGSVTGVLSVGGLVGLNSGSIRTSYVTGSVIGDTRVGGLVGEQRGALSNAYSTATVSGASYVGGLVGSGYGSVSNVYATGVVQGSFMSNGLMGGESLVSNGYWDIQTSGQAASDAGTGKTTIDMYRQGTFKNWDFDCTWTIDEGNSYPQLTYANCSNRTVIVNTCLELQTAVTIVDPIIMINQDIDCSGTINWNSGAGFLPGLGLAVFGSLDGNAYTIANLVINRPTTDGVGLFTSIGPLVKISSVSLVGSSISGNSYVGGLVGYNSGATISDTCISGSVTSLGSYAGGIAGQNDAGTFLANYFSGSVSGGSYVGGLVGENYQGVLTGCYTVGSVSGLAGSNVGGLLGENKGGTLITSYSTSSVMGSSRIGGLIGYNDNNGIINNTYATGSVDGSGDYVGGLVGHNSGAVSQSYATGSVVGVDRVGGLIGYLAGGFSDTTYATGRVVSSGNYVGGLVGQNNGRTTSDSYWDIQASEQANSAGGIGRTTAQMQQKTTFTDWDFVSIWWLHQNYPNLRALVAPPVQVAHPITDMNHTIGYLFSFVVPANTMEDSSDPILDYTAQLLGGSPLPECLTFSAATHTFSGIPLLGAKGRNEIEVIATNDDGYSESDFFILTITNSVPVQDKPLEDQVLSIGATLDYTFAADTFSDYDNHTLSYTATLSNATALPSWLIFISSMRAFFGMSSAGDQGNMVVDLTASDGFGGTIIGTFFLNVTNCVPIQGKPLANQALAVDNTLDYTFPADTFLDCDGDSLLYTAEQDNGEALPSWLYFTASTRTFSGVPRSGDQGSIVVAVAASDGVGGSVTGTFPVTVYNQAPLLQTPLDDITAFYSIPFGMEVPIDTFVDPDGDALFYTAALSGEYPLPDWLSFTSVTRMFTGTPTPADQGQYTIRVKAEDDFGGAASTTFVITVMPISGGNNPPVLAIKIVDQSVYNDEYWLFSLPLGTFEDPDNDPLHYSTNLEGGAPLPGWLSFDEQTQTFSGLPIGVTAWRLTVRAEDGRGGYALDTFTLVVEDAANYPPTVLNPIQNQVAKVGQVFRFTLPTDTFVDSNEDTLNITVSKSGNRPSPKWLVFDEATRTFSGKPSMWDTNTYADRKHTIEVRVSDGIGSAVATFDLFVEGESFWEVFIKTVTPIATLLSVGFAAYRNRATLWNWLCKRWYQLPRQAAVVDEEYRWEISLPGRSKGKRVKYVQVFKDGHVLPGNKLLPDWLAHDTEDNYLTGTPLGKNKGVLTIRAYGYDDRILGEFELGIFETQAEAQEYENPPESRITNNRRNVLMKVLKRKKADPMGKRLLSVEGEDTKV